MKKLLPFFILHLSFLLAAVSCAPKEQRSTLHTVDIKSWEELYEYFRYSPDKDIIISGHRGGMLEGYPENCIASCEKTLSLMPSFFEIDFSFTKDSVLVLMHDLTIDRTTTGTGRVADYTYAELQQFYLKDRQGNVTPYKIPTLLEMLEWGKGKTVFNFDNKYINTKGVGEEDKKRALEYYSRMLDTDWKDFRNIILSVRSLEECKFYYDRHDGVMFCVEISDMAMYEAYRDSGIPWNRLMAYVKYTMDPEKQELYDLIRSHGVMCMTSITPTADKVEPREAKLEAYRHELAVNPDIIETDYPSLFRGLPVER
jgi:glycerophosphoryl diester phosphodiesterase